MEIKYSRDIDSDIIPEVLKIDSAVYPEDMQGSYRSVSARYEKNKDSFILAFDGEKLAGYFCLFPITDSLYRRMLDSRQLFDDNIKPEDICPYKSQNILFLISAAILPEYQNGRTIRLLTDGLRHFLVNKEKKGCRIDTLVCFTVSEAGNRLAKRIGFEPLHTLDNGDILCLCDSKNIRRFTSENGLSS